MRIYLIIWTAVLVGGAGVTKAEPKLESFPSEFDFGFTVKDAAISTRLWLKSTGTDTVNITKINSSCECTTIPLKSDKIAPGDSVEVTIRWDTQQTYGAVKRYPRFYYSGSPEELRVGLKANVLNSPDSTSMAISVWPYRFVFGKIQDISMDSLSFKFVNITDSRIIPSIKGVTPIQCEIILPEIIPARGEAWGYIKLKHEFLDEEFDNSVTFKFTYDEKYFITLPIRRKFYK